MSLKFSREYKRIIDELASALLVIEDIYSFLNMEKNIWEKFQDEERKELIKTLADDIFYGLGQEPLMEIGEDKVQYSKEKNEIYIISKDNIIKTVKL
ncbi:MAG TPA: hypothetical protein DGK91_01310 [Clostridium sp.]|nr:hypothetical protein [Clostridia bacterium]HCW03279.1 hypothetical protein [Clostridium sp.]